jgi:hypothetical protein
MRSRLNLTPAHVAGSFFFFIFEFAELLVQRSTGALSRGALTRRAGKASLLRSGSRGETSPPAGCCVETSAPNSELADNTHFVAAQPLPGFWIEPIASK